MRADFFGCVSKVEFDRSTAAGLEIYEQQPLLRDEHVAWVWLAVQQLLGTAALANCLSQVSQCVGEQLSVRVGELRSLAAACHELLSRVDAIREVRRRNIEIAHAGMQPLERIGVVSWWRPRGVTGW